MGRLRKDHPLQGVLLGGVGRASHLDPPAQRHSATSKEAGRKIKPKVHQLERRVLMVLRTTPSGATDELTCLGGSTLRPRRVNLVRAGFVRDSGWTRPTRSGRSATVWVATDKILEENHGQENREERSARSPVERTGQDGQPASESA